jgi:hypothetical protein
MRKQDYPVPRNKVMLFTCLMSLVLFLRTSQCHFLVPRFHDLPIPETSKATLLPGWSRVGTKAGIGDVRVNGFASKHPLIPLHPCQPVCRGSFFFFLSVQSTNHNVPFH